MAPTLNIPDSLLRLAPEIILAIGNELGLPDIKHFRLSCKAVAAILHHEVFRTVHLEVCKENMVKGVRKIEALAAGKHPACAAARVLSIGMLAPAASRAVLASTIWSPSPYPEETSEAADARKRLAAHLFDAITSLRGVNSVIWEEHEHDCYPASRIAMDAIKELPSLRSVRFRFESWPQIPLELDCLNDLTEISIKTGVAFPPYPELIFDNVAKAIAQNPNLRSIDICNTGIDHLHAYNSLHNLFRLYPRTAPPLGLVNLKLQSVNLCLDDAVVMRHLISLKSISLEDIHPHPSHTSLFYTSLPSNVWRVLDSNGIHLEEITLDEAPPSFIDYLSSYSGLKRLRFIDNPCKPADGTADLFFEKALLGHAQSLECLEIVPPYPEGRWCFSGSNSGRFSIFSKLKHLAVNFQLSDLQDIDHVGEKRSSSPLDPFKLLMDTIVSCMPDIKSVHIVSTSIHADSSHIRCLPELARPTTALSRCFYEKLRRRVECYLAPASCQRLPPLTVEVISCEKMIYMPRIRLFREDDADRQVLGLLGYTCVTPPSTLSLPIAVSSA